MSFKFFKEIQKDNMNILSYSSIKNRRYLGSLYYKKKFNDIKFEIYKEDGIEKIIKKIDNIEIEKKRNKFDYIFIYVTINNEIIYETRELYREWINFNKF